MSGARRPTNGGPAFAPSHHLQHPYRPFTARMEADLILCSYLILSYLLLISYFYLSDLSIILLLKGALVVRLLQPPKTAAAPLIVVRLLPPQTKNNRRRLSNQNPSLERPHQSKPTALQGTPAMPLRRALPCRRRRCSTPSCSALRCARAASALRPRRLCASAPMVPHHGHTLTQLVLERTFPTCRFDPNPSTKVPWPQAVHLCACTQPSVPTPLLQARG